MNRKLIFNTHLLVFVCFAASNLCAENAAVSHAVKRKYLNELVEQMGVEPTTSALRKQSSTCNLLI